MIAVIYHKDVSTSVQGIEFFQSMLSIRPLGQMIRQGMCVDLSGHVVAEQTTATGQSRWIGDTFYAVPDDWVFDGECNQERILRYTDSLTLADVHESLTGIAPWNLILNGNYATRINIDALDKILACSKEQDIVAVKLRENLLGFRENAILTDAGLIAGFRRYFEDSWEPAPTPRHWPQLLLLNNKAMRTVLNMDKLPLSFSQLVCELGQRDLSIKSTAIAGHVHNLCVEDEFLAFYQSQSNLDFAKEDPPHVSPGIRGRQGRADGMSPKQPRLIGNVIIDQNAKVDSGAVILGPSIIAEGASVGKDSIIDSSVIGPGVTVEAHQWVRNRIMTGTRTGENHGHSRRLIGEETAQRRARELDATRRSCFRLWPLLSYARCVKRLGDIAAAFAAIILFLPLVPIIALAIKLCSRGPIFYRARRQGRYGEDFDCLKFRTMKVGADQIQEKLRTVSEVDGPQFKIVDDPRITAVGRFLRDTYLDEIPQFYNVLMGQMSIVGPRPSPRSENIRCPFWRDARLSVRPGVTGLWQVNRTREPMLDFQEWIHYDTEYIRRLSLSLDVEICWRTFSQMVGKFMEKFLGTE